VGKATTLVTVASKKLTGAKATESSADTTGTAARIAASPSSARGVLVKTSDTKSKLYSTPKRSGTYTPTIFENLKKIQR